MKGAVSISMCLTKSALARRSTQDTPVHPLRRPWRTTWPPMDGLALGLALVSVAPPGLRLCFRRFARIMVRGCDCIPDSRTGQTVSNQTVVFTSGPFQGSHTGHCLADSIHIDGTLGTRSAANIMPSTHRAKTTYT